MDWLSPDGLALEDKTFLFLVIILSVGFVRILSPCVLLSTLGGLAIFGFSGFVVGPMIAAMFITVTFSHSPGIAGAE